MRQRIHLVLPTLAGLALTSGCGGGFEDVSALPGQEGVSRVAETYLAALADGDGHLACSLLDVPMQQALIAQRDGTGNCLDAVKGVADTLTTPQKEELSGASIDDATVNGDRGSVRVQLSDALAALAGVNDGVLSLYLDEGHWAVTQSRP